MSASPPPRAVPPSHIALSAPGVLTLRANVLSGSLRQQRKDPLSLVCLTVVFTICREGPTCYASSLLIFTLSHRLLIKRLGSPLHRPWFCPPPPPLRVLQIHFSACVSFGLHFCVLCSPLLWKRHAVDSLIEIPVAERIRCLL